MEQGGPEEVKRLIGALRWARQHYEENEKGRKPGHDLYKGLENRWNAVEKAALGFSAKPLPGTEKFTGQNKHDTRLV